MSFDYFDSRMDLEISRAMQICLPILKEEAHDHCFCSSMIQAARLASAVSVDLDTVMHTDVPDVSSLSAFDSSTCLANDPPAPA